MMNSCVIRKCANGFIVNPDVIEERHASTPLNETRVFIKYEDLFRWIQSSFECAESQETK